MAKLKDKLWNWGHLAGSHNKIVNYECKMSPQQYGEEYGVNNSFIVSYGGNIQPPYNDLALTMSSINDIKWSVLGDGSTPLPDHELGNTLDVIEVAKVAKNITGAVVDDFFSPVRIKRFTPEILTKMKNALNENDLDFWCVLYAKELNDSLKPYLSCFDGITFWIWDCSAIVNQKEYFARLKELAKVTPIMLGIYVYDYSTHNEMDSALLKDQLDYYFDLLRTKEIEGIVFCSSTLGDYDIEANKIIKEYITKYGDEEI